MITESSLDLLEFRKLLRIISDHTHSDVSRRAVLEIAPFADRRGIETRFGQVHEIRRLSQEGSLLRLSPFADLTQLLTKVRPEGAVLEGPELAGFVPLLTIASDISAQLAERRDLPFLQQLAGHLTGFPDILRTLRRSIDSEGHVLDSASPVLAEVRVGIRRLEVRIRKKIEEIVRDSRTAVFLQDDFITQRSGRWVIPVRMDSKGMVPGVVHDVSKSGETAFVEPLAILSLANEIENLIAEEKAEEIRILRAISSRIRHAVDEIESEYRTVIVLDLLNAIARFADRLRMEIPQITDASGIALAGARHPLLTLSLLKTGDSRKVVPLDVGLGGDTAVMVITGSNAGGKTIAIKTIGLLTLMALSGMPVPADSSSSFPLVDDLLIDIGDEQSIEHNLSTFSAHVSRIAVILKRASPKTLVLLDELGTGTDPEEGAALACAVLREIQSSGALLFATTHLTDIKGFVHRTAGMTNASMEFDRSTHSPLYRLRVGEPGLSYALETARRYGMSDRVIDSAREMLGSVKVQFDEMIAELVQKRALCENERAALEKARTELEEKSRHLRERLKESEQAQKEIAANAYREASAIISDTRRQMSALLEEFKRIEKERRRELTQKVLQQQEAVTEKLRQYEGADSRGPTIDEIMEGDVVFLKSLGYDAPVIEVSLRHNRVRVMARNKEIEVPVSEIGYKRGKAAAQVEAAQVTPAEEKVPSRINLVGLRVEEALSLLEPFLNHASLAGLSEVSVIHGIGKGLLSRAVREHLKGHPLVTNFRAGMPAEGGAGVTIVTLV